MTETTTTSLSTTLPPCPAWCRHTETLTDHDYDSVVPETTPGKLARFHSSDPMGEISISAEEFSQGGAVTVGPAHIYCADETFSAAEARERARQLQACADQLDTINGTPLPQPFRLGGQLVERHDGGIRKVKP